MDPNLKQVCVVGAGVAGLVSVKECLDQELLPICYEKDSEIGGLWNYSDPPKTGDTSVYKSCHTVTSKTMTCYSDFPVPKQFPNFMNHTNFKKYLEMYSTHFNLLQFIKFHWKIDRIEKAENYKETGKWVVSASNVLTNEKEIQTFDFIMICTGHFHHPRFPIFPGMDGFRGKLMHSQDYKTFHGFENKQILIIGIGNSAVDIASELSRHADHVYISTRRGTYLHPRTSKEGKPFDHFITRSSSGIPEGMKKHLEDQRMDRNHYLSNYGLTATHSLDDGGVSVSDDLPIRILLGKVNIKPNVKKFTKNGVIFDDGSQLVYIDIVIFATGYNLSFPFLDASLVPIDSGCPNLYDFVFPVNLVHPTFAVMGLIEPVSAVPPIVEMQARWASMIFSGHCQLPSLSEMMQTVTERRQILTKRFSNHPRYVLRTNYIDYMDKLAERIGCRPDLWKIFFTNPKFWYRLYFGPATPQQWRLCGPGRWSGAQEAIETVEEYLWTPVKTRHAAKKDTI